MAHTSLKGHLPRNIRVTETPTRANVTRPHAMRAQTHVQGILTNQRRKLYERTFSPPTQRERQLRSQGKANNIWICNI